MAIEFFPGIGVGGVEVSQIGQQALASLRSGSLTAEPLLEELLGWKETIAVRTTKGAHDADGERNCFLPPEWAPRDVGRDYRQFKGGTVIWNLNRQPEINKPAKWPSINKTGKQSPSIALVHELYHAWQYKNDQRAMKAHFQNPRKDQSLADYLAMVLRIEQPCCNFEAQVAREMGEPYGYDYLHQQCSGGSCVLEKKYPAPSKSWQEKFYCNRKEYVPTKELLWDLYHWGGEPFTTVETYGKNPRHIRTT